MQTYANWQFLKANKRSIIFQTIKETGRITKIIETGKGIFTKNNIVRKLLLQNKRFLIFSAYVFVAEIKREVIEIHQIA
jgi:hypothetical protein